MKLSNFPKTKTHSITYREMFSKIVKNTLLISAFSLMALKTKKNKNRLYCSTQRNTLTQGSMILVHKFVQQNFY